MNTNVYKGFGIFLMIFTFVVIFSIMFNHISDTRPLNKGYDQFDYIWEIVIGGILSSILVFVLGFYPGLFYYRFGKYEKKDSNLVKFGFWLSIMAGILIILVSTLIFFSCIGGCDGLGEGILFFMIAIPALIIYSIGILLLIIFKFKKGNWKFQLVEKISFGIIILLLILSGIVYFIAIGKG